MKKQYFVLASIVILLFSQLRIDMVMAKNLTVSRHAELGISDNEKSQAEDHRANVVINDDTKEVEKTENSAQTFTLSGKITSFNNNSIVLGSQTIMMDSSKVPSFKQKGILQIGANVIIKGIIINNTKYATDINVIGTGQGRLQFIYGGTNPESRIVIKEVGSVGNVVTFLKQIFHFFTVAI